MRATAVAADALGLCQVAGAQDLGREQARLGRRGLINALDADRRGRARIDVAADRHTEVELVQEVGSTPVAAFAPVIVMVPLAMPLGHRHVVIVLQLNYFGGPGRRRWHVRWPRHGTTLAHIPRTGWIAARHERSIPTSGTTHPAGRAEGGSGVRPDPR